MSDVTSLAAGPPASVVGTSQAAAPALLGPAVAPTPRYRTFTFGLGFLCGQASL